MDDLNSILEECAKLRGCYPLMHRTLYEFNWFAGVVIWGWTSYDDYRMESCKNRDGFDEQFWADQRREYNRIHERWNGQYNYSGEELIMLARAFLEYCQEQYGEEMSLFEAASTK